MRIKTRKLKQLKLGQYYIISWGYGYANKTLTQLIQPTRCGYNFLDIETSKCILPRHLYPYKKLSDDTNKVFFIHQFMNAEEVNPDRINHVLKCVHEANRARNNA